jgi:RHS repeat-associated protein
VTDNVGSTELVTDSIGDVLNESLFFPYGVERVISQNDTGNNYKFSGKERDPETGLDDFGARYYESALGRFMTPDWDGKPITVPYAKFGDPQTLNLYSYVENGPLNRVDADGHASWMYSLADMSQTPCSTTGGCMGASPEATLAANDGSDAAIVQNNIQAQAQQAAASTGNNAAQQQSSSGPGLLRRIGQRLNNFVHGNGLVTNAELDQVHGEFTSMYIVDGPVHETEPNPYIAMGMDAASIGAALSGHAYFAGGITAASSVYNPEPMNLGLNAMSFIPGTLGESAAPLTLVMDGGTMAGGVITNNIMAPMLMTIPADTVNVNGVNLPAPDAFDFHSLQ